MISLWTWLQVCISTSGSLFVVCTHMHWHTETLYEYDKHTHTHTHTHTSVISKTTQMFIHCAGYLDQSSDDDTLQPGTKLELPFWLARSLCSRRRHIVSVELPRTYREGYRQVFKADPNVVDLHKLGPYFYGFGSHLLSFQHPESADVANTLVHVRYVFFHLLVFCLWGGGC